MNTDSIPDLRRGGKSKLLLKAETEQIIGFAVIFIRVHPWSKRLLQNEPTHP